MPEQLPKELEDMLYQLEDPDQIQSIQLKWMNYSRELDKYERDYLPRLGAIVQGNLLFKENKTIPTPAEQRQWYIDEIKDEMTGYLGSKGKEPQLEWYGKFDIDQSQDKAAKMIDEFRDQQSKDNQIEQENELYLTFDPQSPANQNKQQDIQKDQIDKERQHDYDDYEYDN